MITKRQKQVLDYLKNYIKENSFAPSLEEIKKYLKLTSVSTAHYHVEALRNMGYIDKEINQPRSLKISQIYKYVQIPLLGNISAGNPVESYENKEFILFPKDRIKKIENTYALRIQGDSMIEENINDGDIVLVRKQDNAKNGEKIVALINNSETTIKRLFLDNNKIRLEPANAKYSPIIVDPKNIEIQGIVIDVIKSTNKSQEISNEITTSNIQKSKDTIKPTHNDQLSTLKDCISKMNPLKEREFVNFYWSKKPINVAQAIYDLYCKNNDIIMDPFVGGGSSLYAIENTTFNVKFIGVDINQLPLELIRFNERNKDIFTISYRKVIDNIISKYKHIYEYKCPKCSSKAYFYKVVLNLDKIVEVKEIIISCNKCNKISLNGNSNIAKEYLMRQSYYRDRIKKYKDETLIRNSRIAITDNMKVSDVFSPINYFLLNAIKEHIKDSKDLRIILSSILHLSKYTDLKSQSQFPYWFPKKDAVDRNIIDLINNKISQIEKYDNIDSKINEVNNFEELKNSKLKSMLLINEPIQKVTKIPNGSIDLIITDPPYFDQVAYSEYLKLWEYFTDFRSNINDEIVVSQRQQEPSNEEEYIKALEVAFCKIHELLKDDGLMFVYFKDTNLSKWYKFVETLSKAGFEYKDQIHIDESKYTYKQNMSVKSTINGNCLLLFKKVQKMSVAKYKDIQKISISNIEDIITGFVKGYLFENKSASLGEIYDSGLIKILLNSGSLNYVEDVNSIVSILDKEFTWDENKREWMLKNKDLHNTLILGDSLKIMKTFPENIFDSCITDPPYNISGYDYKKEIGWYKSSPYWKDYKKFKKMNETWDKFSDEDYIKFTREWLCNVSRIVKPNGNIIVFGSLHNIYKIGFILEEMGLKIINSIVWYKRNAFPNITNRMLCESTEHIIWAVNNDRKNAKNWTFNYKSLKEINNGKQMRNVWNIPSTPKSEKIIGSHPAQKCKEIISRLILGCTNKKDFIIDPFMGAGTIPIVCNELDRYYLGIEKEPKYYIASSNRLRDANSQTKLFKELVRP